MHGKYNIKNDKAHNFCFQKSTNNRMIRWGMIEHASFSRPLHTKENCLHMPRNLYKVTDNFLVYM
jgi:hypothetical protein